ncbi:MAG TPA: AsmA-like C-terminal region-containing protein [Verrucomicrobiae bacterium]|nr:AsmA-like C-terminal region-containing protein [Verrucomicrobiae bacterium]
MKRLFRFLARLFVVVLLLSVVSVVYLNLHGFPPFLKQFVVDELWHYGYAMQFGTIRLDLLRGVVATDAVFADAKEPDQALAIVDEVQLLWSWRRLLRRQNPLDAIRIANATVSVPTPPDEVGPSQFTALQAYATLKFEDDGTIQIDQLTGVYCGIALHMTGRIKPRAATPGEALKRVEAAKSPFTFVTKALRELNSLRITAPPQLDLDFGLDLARPLDGKVKARLRGADFGYRNLRIDAAAVDVEMHDGAITIPQFLVTLSGGEISLHGRYDIAMGEFDLHLTSTIDPTTLAPALPKNVADGLRELRVSENPKITAHYVLSPETGSLPLLSGEVDAGPLEIRSVPFRSVHFAFENRGPEVKVSDAMIVTAEGRLTGSGQYHIESSDFSYQFDSTLDPRKLLPLMTPVVQRIVEPSWFDRPPHIVASVSGDFVDPDAFAYDAQLNARQCSYRGVRLKSASAKLRLRHSRLDAQDLLLAREEGELRGTLLADFNNHQVSFDLDTTANPTEMAPLLGPKAGQIMSPYRFGPRTSANVRGMVDLDEQANSAWTAQVANDGFSYWRFTADHATANLVFTNNTLQINNFDSDFYGGKLRGRAEFVFSGTDASYEFDFSVDRTDAQAVLSALENIQSKVTGLLSGQATISGHGSDLGSLTGRGQLEVTDGILWQAPVFGIFSEILGNTKATSVKATFTIANEAVSTDDMQVAAGAFTAEARGQLGFDGKLDFRVDAQFLRAWPGIGWISPIIGKLLEYKVGGTVGDPKYRAVNLPKELLPNK